MSRPRVIDSFMFNNEFDILEMRLDTMADAVDHIILVEADVDHQNHPKPYYFAENRDRYAKWADKIIDVQASGLPDTPHEPDPWAREWAQRDWVWHGLMRIPNLLTSDIVLHGDVDEVCRPLFIRNIRPRLREFVIAGQAMHCFAVDWLHPDTWGGTVAVTIETAMQLGPRHVGEDGIVYHPGAWQLVRNQRNGIIKPNFETLGTGWFVTPIKNAGWHFSWMGGKEATLSKLNSFCHPEIAERTLVGLNNDQYVTEGFHVDGTRMKPVDVDETWPAYIYERRCPDNWWRPR